VDAQSLLNCWENGRRRHALDRGLLMFAAAVPQSSPDELADRPLGERNAALLRLRRKLFGEELKSCVECPECGEKLEFSLSAATLLARADTRNDWPVSVEVNGRRVRLPTTRDLASVASEADEAGAGAKLLDLLCATGRAGASLEEISRALDEADPCMDFSIELTCPACAHEWNAALDVPAFLWEEIDSRATRLLDEVHLLARAYNWDEEKILGLSEARRNAYLQRVLE
jgi:hypothetical protein